MVAFSGAATGGKDAGVAGTGAGFIGVDGQTPALEEPGSMLCGTLSADPMVLRGASVEPMVPIAPEAGA